jgi:hypothetical protein
MLLGQSFGKGVEAPSDCIAARVSRRNGAICGGEDKRLNVNRIETIAVPLVPLFDETGSEALGAALASEQQC